VELTDRLFPVVEAIVGLAQDHVGTNNVVLLWPEGQFGSRHNKPLEHAAVRYIFTRLDLSTRRLFRPEKTTPCSSTRSTTGSASSRA